MPIPSGGEIVGARFRRMLVSFSKKAPKFGETNRANTGLRAARNHRIYEALAAFSGCFGKAALERVKGIEPSSSAWEAAALPLSYTRTACEIGWHSFHTPSQRGLRFLRYAVIGQYGFDGIMRSFRRTLSSGPITEASSSAPIASRIAFSPPTCLRSCEC